MPLQTSFALRATAAAAVVLSSACSVAIDDAIAASAIERCIPDADPDVGTRTYRVEAMRLPPSPAFGFDLDDHHSDVLDARGCFHEDGPGGVDNAFTSVFQALSPAFDALGLDAFEMADRGILPIEDEIFIELASWNGTDTDDCMKLSVRSTFAGSAAPLVLRDGVGRSTAAFKFNWIAQIPPPGATTCANGCVPFEIPVTVELGRIQLAFGEGDDGMERLVVDELDPRRSTFLGGVLRRDFRSQLEYAIATHHPDLAPTTASTFVRLHDLYTNGENRIGRCDVRVDGTTNADAMSIALTLEGDAVP